MLQFLNSKIDETVKKYCKRQKITVKDFAENSLGISESSYHNKIKGKTSFLIDELLKIEEITSEQIFAVDLQEITAPLNATQESATKYEVNTKKDKLEKIKDSIPPAVVMHINYYITIS